MSPPDPKVVVAAIDTLSTAGMQWTARGSDLAAIPASMADLHMTGLEMGLAALFHGPYEQICAGMEHLLTGAGNVAGKIGDALSTAAAAYAKDEADGVHALKDLW